MRLEYFQLIDKITHLDIAQRTIRVDAQVPATSTIFEGHFPGHPLMPGVLLIEAMAQASGWLIIALARFERMPFLAALKEAKLRTFVTPGTDLTIDAGIVHEGSGFTITSAKVSAGGKPICDSTITFRLAPFPSPEMAASMREIAARVSFPAEAMPHG